VDKFNIKYLRFALFHYFQQNQFECHAKVIEKFLSIFINHEYNMIFHDSDL